MQTNKINRSIVDTASDQMVGGISGPKDGSWGQWSKRTKYVHPKKQREQQRETPCAVRLRLLPFPPDKSQTETHNAQRIDLLAKDAFQTPQRSSLLPPSTLLLLPRRLFLSLLWVSFTLSYSTAFGGPTHSHLSTSSYIPFFCFLSLTAVPPLCRWCSPGACTRLCAGLETSCTSSTTTTTSSRPGHSSATHCW